MSEHFRVFNGIFNSVASLGIMVKAKCLGERVKNQRDGGGQGLGRRGPRVQSLDIGAPS